MTDLVYRGVRYTKLNQSQAPDAKLELRYRGTKYSKVAKPAHERGGVARLVYRGVAFSRPHMDNAVPSPVREDASHLPLAA